MSEKTKILCPYCLIKEIAPIQAICPVCYSKEDELEQNSWDDLRERNNTDEIQMFTLAKKVDEAFQDRKSTRLNSSHTTASRMPSSA